MDGEDDDERDEEHGLKPGEEPDPCDELDQYSDDEERVPLPLLQHDVAQHEESHPLDAYRRTQHLDEATHVPYVGLQQGREERACEVQDEGPVRRPQPGFTVRLVRVAGVQLPHPDAHPHGQHHEADEREPDRPLNGRQIHNGVLRELRHVDAEHVRVEHLRRHLEPLVAHGKEKHGRLALPPEQRHEDGQQQDASGRQERVRRQEPEQRSDGEQRPQRPRQLRVGAGQWLGEEFMICCGCLHNCFL